jgi:dUTPase
MHRDNDLIVLPGVVDTDKYYEAIAFPFNLKDKNFEGMLEAGTPIAQVIPFKRESYSMEVVELDKKRNIVHRRTIASKIYDSYRNGFWSRKEYK